MTINEGPPTLHLEVRIHTVKKEYVWEVEGVCSHLPDTAKDRLLLGEVLEA